MSALADLWGFIAGSGRPPTSGLPVTDPDLPPVPAVKEEFRKIGVV